MSVAGYRPSGPIRAPPSTPSYFIPTVHILSKTDTAVVEERLNQRVEYHPGSALASILCAILGIFGRSCT